MNSSELVFLLEEASAQALLETLLPRLPLDARITPRFIAFEGKQDLDRSLVRKLQFYHTGGQPVRFLVLRDQDSHPDCRLLKQELLVKCETAERAAQSLVRIACTELETIYLADLVAVETAFGLPGLRQRQQSRKFRDPDHLGSPKKELQSLTGDRYQQVGGSRAIGAHLDLANGRSPTFYHLISAIRRLEQALLAELTGSDLVVR